MPVYPIVTPDWYGERYCVECLWGERHPDLPAGDHRVWVVRFGEAGLDTRSLCRPHLAEMRARYLAAGETFPETTDFETENRKH